MKKIFFCFILLAAVMLISSCSPVPAQPQDPEKVISVYCHPDIAAPIIEKFLDLHPDFRYTFTTPYIQDLHYTPLEYKLGVKDAPDIYFVGLPPWAPDATEYTQGAMSGCAMPYEDLGIDVDAGIAKADIFQYIVDIGTRPSDGKVVGLSFNSTACAFLYRRSIANEVWGTDDPKEVRTKIGPGWDKFLKAAEELKAKGCYITAAGLIKGKGSYFNGDFMWRLAENSDRKSWIVDGKLYIDPKREKSFDLYQELVGNGYSTETYDLTKPEKPVLGFFMPASMINHSFVLNEYGTRDDWAACDPPVGFFYSGNWVIANKELENDPEKKAAVAEFIEWMTLDCTENGLQYNLANDMLDDSYSAKTTVASRAVMEKSDGKMGFLGGQNMFEVYISASQLVNTGDRTEYDAVINEIWGGYYGKYSRGECTRDEAIVAFKRKVKEQLGIDAW